MWFILTLILQTLLCYPKALFLPQSSTTGLMHHWPNLMPPDLSLCLALSLLSPTLVLQRPPAAVALPGSPPRFPPADQCPILGDPPPPIPPCPPNQLAHHSFICLHLCALKSTMNSAPLGDRQIVRWYCYSCLTKSRTLV
jgi:hypothetical protein